MVRCWKHSENPLEASCTDGGLAASLHFPHKALWVLLLTAVLLLIFTLSLTGYLGLLQPHSKSLQIIQITVPDQSGAFINQSAVVDPQKDLVIFSIPSSSNQTTTVLFDMKHGLICYKPVDQESCFLRKMEKADYENLHSVLHESSQQSHLQLSWNNTQRQTEFLGVLATGQIDVSSLEDPVRALCQNSYVHWTKRTDGPGKQRLVYFCIDICFPNNICVSVCFYYLPE